MGESPIEVAAVFSEDDVDAYLLSVLKDSDKPVLGALLILLSRTEDHEGVPRFDDEAMEFLEAAKATPLYKFGKKYFDDAGLGATLMESGGFKDYEKDPRSQALLASLRETMLENLEVLRPLVEGAINPLKLDRFK